MRSTVYILTILIFYTISAQKPRIQSMVGDLSNTQINMSSNEVNSVDLIIEVNGEMSKLILPDTLVSYQWFRSNEELTDSTSNSLTVNSFGTYYAIAKNESETEFFSDTIVVNELSITQIKSLGVSCEGIADGAVRISPSGGYGSFSLSLDGTNFQSSWRFSELAQGTHTVFVRSELSKYMISGSFDIGLANTIDNLTEGFENRDPHKVINPDDHLSWGVTGLGSNEGDFSLFMNFYSYSDVGQEDFYILEAPISGDNQMLLSFSYAYARFTSALEAPDSMAIVQSFDCGQTWNVLAQRGGEELETSTPKESYFVPDAEDWQQSSVLIDSASSDYLLAFKATNGFGNLLYVDDISIKEYENQAPVFPDASYSLEENSSHYLTLDAYDYENEKLSFSFDIDSTINDELYFISGNRLYYSSEFLNYEEKAVLHFKSIVQDESFNSDTAKITINVIDVNDKPTLEEEDFYVNELSSGGTEIGTIQAYDEDGDSLSFSLKYYDSEDSLFVINPQTGLISVHPDSTLGDASAISRYDITVKITEWSDEVDSVFTYPDLFLTEISPTVVADTLILAENSANQTLVGVLEINNPSGESVDLSILYGNHNDAFKINSDGQLTVNNSTALDYESIPFFVLGIKAENSFGSQTTLVVIFLEDIVDSAPEGECRITGLTELCDGCGEGYSESFFYDKGNLVTIITDDSYANFSYQDNKITNGFMSWGDYQYGPLAVEYFDGILDEFVWNITESSYNQEYEVIKLKFFYEGDKIVRIDKRSFINSTQYYLVFKWTFEWENDQIKKGTFKEGNADEYEIVYQFDDKVNPFFNQSAYFFFTHYDPSLLLSENNLTTEAGAFSTYITNYEYDENQLFPITAVQTAVYESGSNVSNISYKYESCGIDNSSPLLSDQSFTIDENSPNSTIVGQVSATDPEGNDLTFSILSGNTNNAFALSTTGELTVQTSTELDFETTESFSLEVEVNDGNGGTAQATITVNLNDVDESSNTVPTIADQTFTIDENTANATVVGQVVASDADGDELTFSILSGNINDAFALSTTGELSVQTPSELDFETTPTFSLEVEVNDGNGGTVIATISIELNNIDETALIENTFQLPENSSAGTVIGAVGNFEIGTELFPYLEGNASQIDQNDEAQIKGLDLINSGALEFSAENFDLVLASDNALDFESFSSFKVIVKLCCFTAGSEPSTIITVDVLNVNESTTIEDQMFSIDENSLSGTLVGQVNAFDEDGDALDFSILSGNTNEAFALSTTGELSVQTPSELDFETTPTFNLEIEVNDGNGGAASASITINVNDVDETEPLSAGNDIAGVQVYPNPNKGIVQVIFHDKYIGEEMVLIDFTGKEISRKILQNSEIETDITDQAAGIYLLQIGNKTIKLTKAE